MEIDSREFSNASPVKSVRFGGSVSEILAKLKQVSIKTMFGCFTLFIHSLSFSLTHTPKDEVIKVLHVF